MSAQPGAAGEAPQRLLADSRQLARQVREAQRATWFPLLVLAAVTFAAVPVYGYGHYALNCRNQPGGGRICAVSPTTAWIYWPIALVLAYLVIAGFYLHRARSRGVGTRVLPYAVVGVAIAVVATAVAVWVVARPPVGDTTSWACISRRGMPRGSSSCSAPRRRSAWRCLVLAAVERNWALRRSRWGTWCSRSCRGTTSDG